MLRSLRRFLILPLVLAGLVSLAAPVSAQQEAPAPAMAIFPQPGFPQPGYYSPRLGAYFLLEETAIPSWPVTFVSARLVSNPFPGSPLQQAGLRAGDRIVRMDGTHVTQFQELNNHIDWTSLRVIRNGMGAVSDVTVYIPYQNQPGSMIPPGAAPAPAQAGSGS